MRIVDLSGRTFGRLTVVKRVGKSGGNILWECLCQCGKTHVVMRCNLRTGPKGVKSCGCLGVESRITHGGTNWPEYSVWRQMVSRCTDKGTKQYQDYGGRGIQVYEGWKSDFGAFIAYIGRRPSDQHTIERLDNNGHYEPGNVKWATRIEQGRNMRNNRLITHNNKTQCLAAWAEEVGISTNAISYRLSAGWSVERAMTTPSQRK